MGRWIGPDSWRSHGGASGPLAAARLRHVGGRAAWTVASLGWVGLYHPVDWPDIELGWTIDPAFWGRGLAPEAAAAALDHAERTLGRRDLISVIQPNNRASIRVAEKLGGRPERRMTLRGIRVLIYRHGGAAQGPAGGRQRP